MRSLGDGTWLLQAVLFYKHLIIITSSSHASRQSKELYVKQQRVARQPDGANIICTLAYGEQTQQLQFQKMNLTIPYQKCHKGQSTFVMFVASASHLLLGDDQMNGCEDKTNKMIKINHIMRWWNCIPNYDYGLVVGSSHNITSIIFGRRYHPNIFTLTSHTHTNTSS